MPEFQAYARAICATAEDAEDVAQEAAVRLLTAADPPGRLEALRPWGFKVIRNIAVDNSRRATVRRDYRHDQARLLDGRPATVQDPDRDLWVRRAFEGLTPEHREILFLVDVMGMRYAEAADVIGAPRGTVMSRVSRARQALMARMEGATVAPVRRTAKRTSG